MNVLKQLYLASDYHDESGMIFNADCMEVMSSIKQGGGVRCYIDRYPLRYGKSCG